MILLKSEKARRLLRIILPSVLIPGVVLLGILAFPEKGYAYISLAVTVLALLLFSAGFEQKKIGTRRLIIVAVMTALSVVGRMIPFFKPVTALTILTALYLGGEAGFLTGALSAVLSNFTFGQGPWTPFQMMAWGLIGLLAGLLAKPMREKPWLLYLFGFCSGILFSLIMDVWTVLWYNESLSLALYGTALLSALPFTALYSVSNVVFLRLLAKPFGEKLSRVKIKYGV